MKKKFFQLSTSIILGICLFVMMPHFVSAITLDKISYYANDPIVILDCSGSPIVLYDVDTGQPLFGSAGCNPDQDINDGSLGSSVNYSIIEMSTDIGCYAYGLSYDDCKNTPEFIGEATFTILPTPSGGGGFIPEEEDEEGFIGSGVISHRPEVIIISPKEGSVFSMEGLIQYEATDKNDLSSGDDKTRLGMSLTPVSIFYSSTISEWDHSLIHDEDKIFIAKDLPAVSSYLWKVKGLVEGKLYRIIVDAVDAIGTVGESVSEFFSVDLSPPVFVVSALPQVAKDEDVIITIESSEELMGLPEVFVKQNKGTSTPIKITGSGKTYTGTYTVISGFDGIARIEVTGLDLANNKGSLIVGGGTFSVGVNPPRKPEITFTKENERIDGESIDIIGTTREDTEIIATINGTKVYNATPGADGKFIIKGVSLEKKITNGVNIINIIAKDRAGLESQAEVLHISSNTAPTVAFVKPEQNSTLTATSSIVLQTSDNNGDRVSFTYELAESNQVVGEEDWQVISNTPNEKITFDTTEFMDGNYILRVVADDGATTTISNLLRIRIRNELPFIKFDNGRNTIVKDKTGTISGTVLASETLIVSNITRLEYSLNSGKTWALVGSQDGVWNSQEERFSVNFKNLKEGVNNVLWRATDSRGFTVKVKHPITVDTQAPLEPNIIFPENNKTLTETDNDSQTKGKFSFTLRGKSETGSSVYVEIAGKQFITKTLYDGTFRIPNVGPVAKGKNILKTYSTDKAGNKSGVSEYVFSYNNPPELVLTSPRDGRGLNEKTVIAWLTNDPDGDTLSNVVLSYRLLGGPFVLISKNNKGNKFEWDTSKLTERKDYELRLEVSDGFATSTVYTSFSIDRTVPSLSELISKKSIYGKNDTFEATGFAEDSGSGIEFVEYRFEPVSKGQSDILSTTPWYKAIIVRGFLSKKADFLIKTKFSLTDGEYVVISRSVDASGNVSIEKVQNIRIDSTPPRVGAFEIMSQGVNLSSSEGVFNAITGIKFSIKLSLESDTKNANIKIGEKEFLLTKDLATGLWNGEFSFDAPGMVTPLVSAVDVFGNELRDKTLASFSVLKRGKIVYLGKDGLDKPVSGAKVIVTEIKSDNSFWSLFDSNKTTTVESDELGGYTFLLRAGTYEIVVKKEEFNTSEISTIILNSSHFVTNDFILEEDLNSRSLWGKFLDVLQ